MQTQITTNSDCASRFSGMLAGNILDDGRADAAEMEKWLDDVRPATVRLLPLDAIMRPVYWIIAALIVINIAQAFPSPINALTATIAGAGVSCAARQVAP